MNGARRTRGTGRTRGAGAMDVLKKKNALNNGEWA